MAFRLLAIVFALSQIFVQRAYSQEKLPEALADKKLLQSLSNPSTTYQTIEELKKNPKFKVAVVRSEISPVIGNAADPRLDTDHLVLLYSENGKDFWAQMDIPRKHDLRDWISLNKGPDLPMSNLSVITVEKTGNRPTISFANYVRKKRGGLHFDRNQTKVCISCHIGGMQSIYQRSDLKMSADEEKIINEMNEKFITYGIVNAVGKTSELKTNLIMGSLDPEFRTDEFIKSCTPKLGPQSRQKVKKAMNCAGCHAGSLKTDPDTNRVLNSDQLYTAFKVGAYELAHVYWNPIKDEMIEKLILKGHMPIGPKLAIEERQALLDCLREEMKQNPQRERSFVNSIDKTSTEELKSVKETVPAGKTIKSGDLIRKSKDAR